MLIGFITVKSNWEAEDDEKMPDDVIIANMGYVHHVVSKYPIVTQRYIDLLCMVRRKPLRARWPDSYP